jgi:hypothetical protein
MRIRRGFRHSGRKVKGTQRINKGFTKEFRLNKLRETKRKR